MAELVTVHKTIETDVLRVVAYLENRCLHPVVLDDTEKMGPYRSQTREIRIAVPETERDMAVQILDRMQRQESLRLLPVVKRANAVVFVIIAVLGILALVGFLDTGGWWFLGLGATLVAMAAVALIRLAWRRKPHAPPDEEPDHR